MCVKASSLRFLAANEVSEAGDRRTLYYFMYYITYTLHITILSEMESLEGMKNKTAIAIAVSGCIHADKKRIHTSTM